MSGPCGWTITTSSSSSAWRFLPITRKWSGTKWRLPGGRIEIALENLLLLTDSRTARVLVTVLLFALALGFLYVARATLIAFLFAIFFAYLMSPLVNRLETLLRGRVRAIAVIYSLLLVLVVVFFVVVGPKVTREGREAGTVPARPARATQFRPARDSNSARSMAGTSATTDLAQSFLASHSDEITATGAARRACAWPTSPSRRGCFSWCHCFRSSS